MVMRLDSPIFTDATKAREHLEAQRWPNGPVCPHCGNVEQSKITSLQGTKHRPCAFSVFKRGMIGTYQHCGEAHLHRYLAEFDFRYNRRSKVGVEDTERHDMLLGMIGGKRLTYGRLVKPVSPKQRLKIIKRFGKKWKAG
jgi:hypothetical protein